jgi:hypothetical protein
MNILRDPPKGVYTRYKPKVGETSDITQQIQDSGDRVCEAIQVYARGVNPMVSVSYSNNGSNGGQVRYRSGAASDQPRLSTGQAYLPYRIMRDGAFRPPVIPPQELLPLSRLPRIFCKPSTNAGSSALNFAQQTECRTDLREIRKQLLQVCAAPKAIFNIERSEAQPIHLDNYIDKGVNAKNVISNKGRVGGVLNTNSTPDRGINKNVVYKPVTSTPYKNIQVQGLDGYSGNQPMPIKDHLTTSCTSNINSSGGVNKYIHQEKELDRNLPRSSFMANRTNHQIDVSAHNNSHNYKLPARMQPGSFFNNGSIPSYSRVDVPVERKHESIMQKAARQRESRYQ